MLNCGVLLSDECVVDVFNRLIIHYDNSFFWLIHYFLKSISYDGIGFEFGLFSLGVKSDEPAYNNVIKDNYYIVKIDVVKALRVWLDC